MGFFAQPRSALAVAALAFAWAGGALAQGTRIEVAIDGGGAGEVEVLAEAFGGPAAEERPAPVTRRLVVPGALELELAPRWSWRLRAGGEWLWAAPLEVLAGQPTRPLSWTLFPAGRLEGRLALPLGQVLPAEVEIRLEEVPKLEPLERTGPVQLRPRKLPAGVLRCPVAEGAFACLAPAGELDLSVRVEGYAPEYRWGQRLEPRGRLALGTARLEKGASLTGWVMTSQGPPVRAGCEVELAPQLGSLRTPTDLERQRLRVRSARTDERGFFQLRGLEPGGYILTAKLEGFVPSKVPNVSLGGEGETRLEAPVVLEPPLTLEVIISPPVDPYRQPWVLKLFERGVGAHRLEDVGPAEPAGEDGRWRRSGLAAGSYWLSVEDSKGGEYHFEPFAFSRETGPLELRFDPVEVEGTLTRRGEPVAGKIWFGGRFAAIGTAVDTDAEGRFETVLPRPGEWHIDVSVGTSRSHNRLEPIEIARPEGGSRAFVELALPLGQIGGRVVDEAGAPVAGGYALLTRRDRREAPVQAPVTAEGRFLFEAVLAGKFQVLVEGRGRQSEPLDLELAKDEARLDLVLVLRADRKLRGRVQFGERGISGAKLLAHPIAAERTDAAVAMAEAVTAADGTFELSLPSWTERVDVTLMAPGFALAFADLPWSEGASLDLPLSREMGGLRLDLPPAEPGARPSAQLDLSWDGRPLWLNLLHSWARVQGGEPWTSRESHLIPGMPPGRYRACLRPADGERGEAPCVEGVLAPGGELVLPIATASAGSAAPPP